MIESFMAFKVIGSIFSFWSRLPSSIKVLLIILMAFAGGFLWGAHKEKVKWQAEKAASVAEAVRIDKDAANIALSNALADKDRWQKQAVDIENKLKEAATEYQTAKDKCIDEEFARKNNDIDDLLTNSKRLQDHVPKSHKEPPRSR